MLSVSSYLQYRDSVELMAVELDVSICKIYLTVFEDLIVATQGDNTPF